MDLRLVTILLWVLHPYIVPGKRMRWVPNTNLDNPDNYDPKGHPCRNDHLTFPSRGPTVYLQRNQTLVEIVLPNDGEIVMAEGAVLTLPEREDNSCTGRNVRFVGAVARSWFDPGNWCVTEDWSDNCLSSQPYLLDTERIPCDSDDVIFPPGIGFYVELQTDIPIQMGSLRIAGKSMTTGSFRSFLDSDAGKLSFTSLNGSLSDTRVTIGGSQGCSDVTGCICRTAPESCQGRVCDLESPRCGHVTCGNPFQPIGRCCHVCGALIVLYFRTGFKIRDLQNLIADTFRNQNVDQRSVRYAVSKINSSVIQVVLESINNDETALRVGRRVKEELERDPTYGAYDVSLHSSGLNQPEHHTGEGPSNRSGVIAGVIIAIIIVVILVLGVFYCYRNRDRIPTRPKLPSISFPSPSDFRNIFRSDFRSRDDDAFEMRHQTAVFDNSRVFDVNLGFENPTYGDLYAKFEDPEIQKSGYNNPAYDNSHGVEEKRPIPDEYIGYDPPEKPAESLPKVTPAEPKVKEVDPGTGGRRAVSGSSDEERTESLSRRLQAPFRLVASKLKGPKLEEEVEVEEEGLDKDAVEARLRTNDPGKKGERGTLFGKARQHERLEEVDDDGGQTVGGGGGEGRVESRSKRGAEGRKEEGFGNPLYAGEEDVETVETDLGDPGPTSVEYEAGQRSGRNLGSGKEDRTGFENPLFDDSKTKPEVEAGALSQRILGAVERDDESTA